MCRARFACCICLSFILLRIFTSPVIWLCFLQKPLQATTRMPCFLVRPNAVRCQPWSAEIYLRFPIARDHVIILKFNSPFHIITGHKLVVTSFADGSGGPIALRTSPLVSELTLTCEALPFAGGPSGPYLSACGGQLLSVRYAHYARGASLSTFGFVTLVPRYFAAAK